MGTREDLLKLREDIDNIDYRLIKLFIERMDISERVARVKEMGNIAITDENREQQVLDKAAETAGESNKAEAQILMRTLISLSKMRQNDKLMLTDPVSFPPPSKKDRQNATIAFQGVPGAWSEHSAVQLFPKSALLQCDYFEDVFLAVKNGKADYGVLPIENSQTGAIGEVYDLLRRHSCYIVGQNWVSVTQCLLGCEGTKLSDIREVFSHPEGFSQCRRFLKNRSWELTDCRNTAYAAQLVAEKQSSKYAAIGSRRAAETHGLSVIAPDIMDDAKNKTRFIAIAAQPDYDENSEITSITFSTAHKSGALCAVLESFMLDGINLSRIESRPGSLDRYRFFADLEANILDSRTLEALRRASMQCDYFEVLGCYSASGEAL